MTVYWAAEGAVEETPSLTRNDADPAAAQPHLIVALGDIGRRAVAELRRTLDRPFGSRAALSVPVDYLLIDVDGGEGESCLTLDMESVRDFAGQLPDEVRQWLFRHEAAKEIGSDTAADLRRLGSLLVAARADRLQKLLDGRAGELLRQADTARLCIHVVGYLAGGVGGGALTQLLIQLRRNRVAAGRCQVVLYGLPPDGEPDPPERDETDEAGGQRLCDEIRMISPPADGGQTARGVGALPEALAMTVRQRLFMPEALADGPSARDGGEGRPVLAVSPMVASTAGDEAEEALSVSLLQTALHQLVYAHWRPGRGFVGEARAFDCAAHVARAEIQSAWLLSAEHLIQSAPILDADMAGGRWKSLAEDWRPGPAGSFELMEGGPRKDWLDILFQRWEWRFREEFRGVGVAAFYSGRLTLRRDMARAIRGKVEAALFEGWRDGEIGLACACGMVEAMIVQQRERLAGADDRIATIRLAEEACRVRSLAVRQKWARPRSWGGGRQAAAALVNDYAIALQELFLNRTRAEGWQFAKALLPMVIEELDSLRQLLDRLIGISLQGARGADLMLDGLSARLEQGEAAGDFVQQVLDRRKVQSFVRDMLVDEAAQRDHCRQAREILMRHAGAPGEFQSIVQWAGSPEWMEALAALSRKQIVGAEGVWTARVRDILAGSIYQALQQRTDGDFGRLRDLAAALTERAISLLPEDARSDAPIRIDVLLPRDDGQEAFIRTLKSAFSFSRRHEISFIEAEDCRDRMSILAATAPRLISDVEFLRHLDRRYRPYADRYRDHVMPASHDGREDEPAAPSLDGRGSAGLTASLLLIGLPLDLVVERFGAGDRLGQLWLIPKGEDGFEGQPIAVADDLLGAPRQMSPALASLLEDNVNRALAAFPGDRERLVRAIVEWIVKLRALCRDDPFDETYRLYVEAGKLAVSMVRGRAGKALTND